MYAIALNTFIRSVVIFVLMMILTRLITRKLISEMTFFDFVVAIIIGEVGAEYALAHQRTPLGAAITLVVLTALAIITAKLSMKSVKLRKLLNSEPVVLVARGQIIYRNIKRMRVTVNDLLSVLREKDVFNIADAEYVIMEPTGKFSVLLKHDKHPVTVSDLNLQTTYKGLTTDLVIDGRVMSENLKQTNFDEKWLDEQLKKNGALNIKDVLYAGLDSNGGLYVSIKDYNKKESQGKYGIE
ncbi:MAG: DUF421 domain-containing protein [Bacillota bacterium]|nr:DUF421 domain-containing protein [Bacillota bacterium]